MLVTLCLTIPGRSLAQQSVPDALYPGLEYLLSVPVTKKDFARDQVSGIVDFVRSTAADTSMAMQDRNKATGAFYSFTLRGTLARLTEYVYNPDIPIYVTMPSSVREQEWLDRSMDMELKKLAQSIGQRGTALIRGTEREVITPDANTGGYYAYKQNRAMAVFPGPTGQVLISVSCQSEPSDVGRKGCVVGDDANWNYLYSEEKGLTKTGLGWVDSYMYNAHSVLVFVADDAAGIVRVGSFKWLNAGWAGMNMVKASHIINGIKRFASDFKTVLESPRLPGAKELAAMYRDLLADSAESLRATVAPYLEALARGEGSSSLTGTFRKLLASGDYLRNMSREEMVKVAFKEYLKQRLGRQSLIQVVRVGTLWTAQP